MGDQAGSIVTILFTDEVASTETQERIGDDAADTLRAVRFALLRDAIASHHGEEVKTIGDSVMVVFTSAIDALACAIDMQRAVARTNEDRGGEPLGLRVGLDAGEPIRRDADYFGTPVVVARRLCDQAEGGQIVASDLVRRLAGSRGGYAYRGLGALPLKGLSYPIEAAAVLWEARDETTAPAAVAAELAMPPMPEWLDVTHLAPFVGRREDLALLRASLEQVRRGELRAVLIEGDPGIGKTRLAIELAREAADAGAAVTIARCEQYGVDPLRPCADALAALAPHLSRGGAALTHTAMARLREAAEGHAAGDREAVVAAFEEAASERPVVLIVDDVHWAGDALRLLLVRLVAGLGRSPVLMLFTSREHLSARDPLAMAFAGLRQQHAFQRTTLSGLAEADARSLIEAICGCRVQADLRRALIDRSEGNPLFIEELLRHLGETDALHERDGELTSAVSIDEIELPAAIEEMIVHRLAFLSEECNRVLAAGSVIGREFQLEALERATRMEPDALVESLEEAMRAGVLRESPAAEDRYVFAHPLVRDTLYHGLTATRRARLHNQTMQYVAREGVRLAFEEIGAAGPSLIATGISNCPAVRVRSLIATRRWERVSRTCRVLLYDRRGIGSSDAPLHGYSVRACVDDVRSVLFAAGAARAIIWGAADGGPLALAFAATYPERTLGMILSGTSARLINDAEWRLGISDEAMAGLGPVEEMDKSAAASRLTHVRETIGQEANAVSEMMRRVPQHAWEKIRGCFGASDVRGLLAGLQTPVLILHDAGNRYIPVEAAHYLHEHIAGSRLLVTDELAAPLLGDTIYAAVESFVSSCAGAQVTT